jgi:ABC-type nitrate/sulfonate/bicarbonate transport system permease component
MLTPTGSFHAAAPAADAASEPKFQDRIADPVFAFLRAVSLIAILFSILVFGFGAVPYTNVNSIYGTYG